MTPLLVATGGHIPCRSPGRLATGGFIGSCGVTPTQVESPHIGGYDVFHGPDPLLTQAMREDEEILILMRTFIGVINAN